MMKKKIGKVFFIKAEIKAEKSEDMKFLFVGDSKTYQYENVQLLGGWILI